MIGCVALFALLGFVVGRIVTGEVPTTEPAGPWETQSKAAEAPAPSAGDDSEENTSALGRPYFTSPGTGGFSNDKSTKIVKLAVPFMNNSLHSAFDLRTRLVLIEQGNFTIRAAEDTSMAGEISPIQQTELFWHAPKYVGKAPTMPPMYVILALQYSGKPDLPKPQCYQLLYMKWPGMVAGVVAPRMTYLEIPERDKLIEEIGKHNLGISPSNDQHP